MPFAWRSMRRARSSSICCWWATSTADCATTTTLSTAPSTGRRRGLGNASFTPLTLFLTLCDRDSVNGESSGEVDHRVECLPQGDLERPEAADPCTEALKHVTGEAQASTRNSIHLPKARLRHPEGRKPSAVHDGGAARERPDPAFPLRPRSRSSRPRRNESILAVLAVLTILPVLPVLPVFPVRPVLTWWAEGAGRTGRTGGAGRTGGTRLEVFSQVDGLCLQTVDLHLLGDECSRLRYERDGQHHAEHKRAPRAQRFNHASHIAPHFV